MTALIVDHKWRIAHEGEREVLEALPYADRPFGYNGTCGKSRAEHARASGKKLDRCRCVAYHRKPGGMCACTHGREDHLTLIAGRPGRCHRELS